MFRTLTRGNGEKTQLRNTKANYPQLRLAEIKIPNPQSLQTTNDGSSILSFSNQSFDNPSRLNKNNSLYKKSDKGNGLQRINYAFTDANETTWLDTSEPKNTGRTNNRTSIVSFGQPEILRYRKDAAWVNSLGLPLNTFYNRDASSFIGLAFGSIDMDSRFIDEIVKGTTLSFLFQPKGEMLSGSLFGYVKENITLFQLYRPSQLFAKRPIHPISNNASAIRIMGNVNYFGDVSYYEINFNQYKNADWLLKQKTQYQFAKV